MSKEELICLLLKSESKEEKLKAKIKSLKINN
jgi:hypothetical protein